MTRRRAKEERPRVRQSDGAMRAGVEADLTTLEVLVGAFDSGHAGAAGAIAAQIINVVTNANAEAIRHRGTLRFPTPSEDLSHIAPDPINRLVSLQVSGRPTGEVAAAFRPWATTDHGPPVQLSFTEWWRKDVVYRGRQPDGAVVTRERFVLDIRNAMGAHRLSEIPAILDDLQQVQSYAMMPVSQSLDGAVLTVQNGGITLKVTPAEAMARQIAEEVLMAYGRRTALQWSLPAIPVPLV